MPDAATVHLRTVEGAMTQTEALLALLRERESVTALEALEEIGSFRLAARIWDLRMAGHLILADTVKTPNGARIARYRLVEPQQLTAFG